MKNTNICERNNWIIFWIELYECLVLLLVSEIANVEYLIQFVSPFFVNVSKTNLLKLFVFIERVLKFLKPVDKNLHTAVEKPRILTRPWNAFFQNNHFCTFAKYWICLSIFVVHFNNKAEPKKIRKWIKHNKTWFNYSILFFIAKQIYRTERIWSRPSIQ